MLMCQAQCKGGDFSKAGREVAVSSALCDNADFSSCEHIAGHLRRLAAAGTVDMAEHIAETQHNETWLASLGAFHILRELSLQQCTAGICRYAAMQAIAKGFNVLQLCTSSWQNRSSW